MSRFDPALMRSTLVFSIFFVFLVLGLHVQYRSSTFEEGIEPLLLIWLLLATGAALWLGRPGSAAIVNIAVAPIQRFDLGAVIALVVFALITYLIVAGWVLDAFPNSGDELAYVLQAKTYAQGQLWVDLPPLIDAFRQYHFYDIGDKWISQYPPGWAMVLAPVAALGLPLWIVNPLIGAATLAAFFVLARHYVSRESAWIGLLLLGGTSFFILNSGSYFSHNLTALYGVVFALFGLRYIERHEIWCAVAAGACIGLVGLTRTQNAVLFAVPFIIALAMMPERRTGLVWFALGGAPFLLALLGYNAAVTGDPLVAVQNWRGSEPIGDLSGRTIWLTWRLFVRLYIWTSPVLLFGFMAAFVIALKQRRADFCDWIMPVTIGAFLIYGGDGGNQYGPRYYFEGWPFAVLTILKVIDPILFGAKRGSHAAWVSSALIASLVFQISYLPARFEREHRVVLERQDVYTQVENAGLDNALVIIASVVGAIRPMWPGDLVRNGLEIGEQNIIYARPLGERRAMFLSQFPDRSMYVYLDGRLLPAPRP